MDKREQLTMLTPSVRSWLNLAMIKIGSNLGEVKLGRKERHMFQLVGRAAIGLDQMVRAYRAGDQAELERLATLYEKGAV